MLHSENWGQPRRIAVTKFSYSLGIGFFVVVTGGSYVSTKAGSNGSAERQVASPALAQIEPTRAEEALRPRQHRPAPISRWLEAAN